MRKVLLVEYFMKIHTQTQKILGQIRGRKGDEDDMYTVKSTSKILQNTKAFAIPNVKYFIWRTRLNNIAIKENIFHKEIIISCRQCSLCKRTRGNMSAFSFDL